MIGQTISHYTIVDKLGEGGMGEVFLAEDAKLDRKVALKFLPPDVASDPEVKARFIQEAKAASALQHPNVCTIHDIQEHDGRMYIVMEHVDGATLADKKGQLSLKKAVNVAAQVADGLGAAHEKGIVHRDVKAENIMLRADGIAQIMDFGLAKLRGVSRLTREGSTVGTTPYMSPEAIQGHDTDHRTDLYSLGVVLFELVTGRLPFDAVHDTAVMYEIVHVDAPPPSAVQPGLDPELDRIILECLEKDPDERYQSARELAKDLRRFTRDSGRKRVSQVSSVRPAYQKPAAIAGVPTPSRIQPAAEPSALAPAAAKPSRTPWLVAAALFVGLVAVSVMGFVQTEPPPRVVRSHIVIPEGGQLESWGGGHIAVSPNGKTLAYVASDSVSSESFLWVRDLSALTALKLPGTKDAKYPFWSPDSKHIGFFQQDKLMKIQATGGPALTVCEADDGRLGSWNSDDIIIFSPDYTEVLYHVPAAGGKADTLTFPDTTVSDRTHRWPWFLPDGKRFLYFARTAASTGSENDAICVGSLDGSVYKRLVHAKSNVAYAAGHVLFMRTNTLMARPFDVGRLEFTGDAYPVAENVAFNSQFSRGSFTVSDNGILIYQSGEFTVGSSILIYNRNGQVVDTVGEPERFSAVAFSPDGTHVLVDFNDQTSSQWDIWSYNLERGIRTRLTFDGKDDGFPVWHPSGETFVFSSNRDGEQWNVYAKASNGIGSDSLLIESKHLLIPRSYSRDGRYLIVEQVDSGSTDRNIWAYPMTGAEEPLQLTNSEFPQSEAMISPDGRWLAWTSEESGAEEVYVAPFPSMNGKWQVSINKGNRPRWRADGRELFYLDYDDHIMAADVDGSGSSFRIGAVTRLFELQPQAGTVYDVSADGQRFVVNTNLSPTDISTATMVLNWDAELADK
jgi:serine/threonine protein kinase